MTQNSQLHWGKLNDLKNTSPHFQLLKIQTLFGTIRLSICLFEFDCLEDLTRLKGLLCHLRILTIWPDALQCWFFYEVFRFSVARS